MRLQPFVVDILTATDRLSDSHLKSFVPSTKRYISSAYTARSRPVNSVVLDLQESLRSVPILGLIMLQRA